MEWDGVERRKTPRSVCQAHSGLDTSINDIKTLLKIYIGLSASGTLAIIGWIFILQRDMNNIYNHLPKIIAWLRVSFGV